MITSLFSKGLYSKVSLPEDGWKKMVINAVVERSAADFYCSGCEKEKTFTQMPYKIVFKKDEERFVVNRASGFSVYNEDIFRTENNSTISIGFYLIKGFFCPTCKYEITQYYYVAKDLIQKVGENPSYYDIHKNDITPYKDYINKEDFETLKKAEMLAGQGYYIGAATYLRRIFESIISMVFDSNQVAIKLSPEEFKKLKTHQKIDKVRTYLPKSKASHEMFKKDSKFYTAVSDGVHNLTEEECQKVYPVFKAAIIMILTDIKTEKEIFATIQSYGKKG